MMALLKTNLDRANVLYSRIKDLQPPSPSFFDKVRNELGGLEVNSDDLWDEYLRFVALAGVKNVRVVPSQIIDVVWHLHLQYSRHYRVELCKRLGVFVDHEPTDDAELAEEDFFAYAETLIIYVKAYDQWPIKDYWPIGEVSAIPEGELLRRAKKYRGGRSVLKPSQLSLVPVVRFSHSSSHRDYSRNDELFPLWILFWMSSSNASEHQFEADYSKERGEDEDPSGSSGASWVPVTSADESSGSAESSSSCSSPSSASSCGSSCGGGGCGG